MRFEDLNLNDRLLDAVRDAGYTDPTPIQQQAVPHVMAGKDLIGLAQTGTGKTAAFALPVLHRLNEINPKGKRFVQVLVLAPTRELATQIHESFTAYGKYTRYNAMTIFGGVSQKPQVKQLNRGVNIVVATPGRLLDLMGQGEIRLNRLSVLILDEADRMFDMGFLPDIRRIVKELPTERQTLLFSATMPPDIQALASEILIAPEKVEVAPESTTVEAIDQHVYFVEKGDKRQLLTHLINENNMHRTLVFTRTKRGADRLSQQLSKQNIPSDAIHGNKSNNARNRALDKFKSGKVQVLVATDIVARGIDVDEISHVVNYELPNESESYVHRIGRTARAGTSGVAVSLVAEDERKYLWDIERLIQMHMDVVEDHPYASSHGTPEPTRLEGSRRSGSSSGGNRNGSSRKSNNRSRNRRGKGNGSRNRNFKSGGGSKNGNRSRNNQKRSTPTPT